MELKKKDDQLYDYARKMVRDKRNFYVSLMRWATFSVFFVVLNIFTSGYFWAIFPIMAWGIGVAMKGINVYSKYWEKSELERTIQRFNNIEEEMTIDSKRWKEEDLV